MDANERIVHGAFTNSDDTISAIRKLNEEGYSKDRIRVYSNHSDFESYDATEENPRREEGSYDITDKDSRERSREGSFDITDEDSKERSKDGSFDRVDRGIDENQKDTHTEDNDSVWESVKDFFTPDTYDYERESENPDYNPDQDILYPYREDLSRGHHIIVLDNQHTSSGPGNI